MIILKNEGEIDINVITTMGVNIKDCDDPIGFFGTGLKYAIAVFLRERIDVRLFIGENEYTFHAEPRRIRNKEFNICKMVGKYDSMDLGFTTELGKNWEIWQAYREIESNCRDEMGRVYKASGEAKGDSGYTKFVISNLPEIGEVFLDKAKKSLLLRNDSIEIFKGESDTIYYKGIKAKVLKSPSKYTYNILKDCYLTEDRLLCYDWQVEEIINDAVAQMKDKEIIKDVITAKSGTYEHSLGMGYSSNAKPNKEFMEAYQENKNSVNSSVNDFVKKHTPKEPKTDAERREEFKQSLSDLCSTYSLHYEIDEDGYVSIVACDLLKPEEG